FPARARRRQERALRLRAVAPVLDDLLHDEPHDDAREREHEDRREDREHGERAFAGAREITAARKPVAAAAAALGHAAEAAAARAGLRHLAHGARARVGAPYLVVELAAADLLAERDGFVVLALAISAVAEDGPAGNADPGAHPIHRIVSGL